MRPVPSESEIRQLVAEFARVPPEGLRADVDLFSELGIDSLEALKLLAWIEQKYDIRIPDHQLTSLNTLDRIAAFVQQQPGPEDSRRGGSAP